jgi:DNA-binding TFAR19-related protein (PDSD5 family)
VAIRTAAGELRGYAIRPRSTGLDAARRELERARYALTAVDTEGSVAPSGLVTEGVRDRLHNLEMSQKERALEVEEELGP